MDIVVPIVLPVAAIVIVGIWYLQRRLGGTAGAAAELQAARQELVALDARFEARNAELARLSTEHDQARTELRALNEQLTQRAAELAAAKSALDNLPVLTRERDAARASLDELNRQHADLNAELARLRMQQQQEQRAAAEKQKLLEEAEQRLTTQFENLANRIFDAKHEKFAEASKSGVENLLKPVREQLEGFRKKVEDVYDKESKDRTSLLAQVLQLKELNEKMSAEANNLTRALKGDSKARGNWGEIQLERLLEASGLVKGREYEVQVGSQNAEGKRYITDVVIHLPEKKDVIIDSKVSLVAYDRYHAAATDEERQLAIREHIASLRTHISSLGEKNYSDLLGINSLDLVIMFMPIDAALLLALEHDPGLTDAAFGQRVWLVSPMNLVGTLRIIYNIWRYEYQNNNAMEIANQAGALHDKFVGFAESLEDIGKHIEKTQSAYESAHKQLVSGSGNLVGRTVKLQKLGAKAKKNMPESLLQEAEIAQQFIEGPASTDARIRTPGTGE